MGAISFDLLEGDQWTRLVEAFYQRTQDLKREVIAGILTGEPVQTGIEKKLDELLALFSCFLYQDRDKYGRQGCPGLRSPCRSAR